ncbi:tRNA A64-2'-O-ribosylphosphate transferase [Rhodotorula toruloides]
MVSNSTVPQLVFPHAVETLQADRGAIRSQLRDTYNRLHSLAHDATWVHSEVAAAYPDFPLVANQRAGAWYVKPSPEEAHAYFKSTDGHAGEHNFNLRRANLALLPLIKERGGIVLVDSTRRGKRFPDALSKTMPLWCATLNRTREIILPPAPDNSSVSLEVWKEQARLYTSPQAVGRSEHAQIEAKVEKWANELASSAYDLSSLKALDRPLRPFFVSPASTLSRSPASSFKTCYPAVCASASKLAEEADGLERAEGFTYVQGSGDDHEAWSRGLTPPVFWRHADEILTASREEIDDVIERILAAEDTPATSTASSPIPIRQTGLHLRFAVPSDTPPPSGQVSISVTTTKTPSPSDDSTQPSDLSAKPGKAGYNSFFAPDYLEPVLSNASTALRNGRGVCISVEKGEAQSEANDLGVAVSLILLTRLYDDDGDLRQVDTPTPPITKDFIRTRLHWILEALPTVNPSRAALNRVNDFLMSKRR